MEQRIFELLAFTQEGGSQEKLDKILVKFTPEELASREPIECLIDQRRYIESVRLRAAQLFQQEHPIETFPNSRDWFTHLDIRIAQEIAMTFCNTKDPWGSQLANTVEELAQRCVKAEAGSKKQALLIEDLQDENESLKAEIRGYGSGKGG